MRRSNSQGQEFYCYDSYHVVGLALRLLYSPHCDPRALSVRPPLISIQHSTSFIYHTVHPYITLSMGNTAHPHLYTAQHLIHISHSSSIYHTYQWGNTAPPLISIQHSTPFIYHTVHPYITLSMGNTAHPSSLYSTAPHSYITQFIHISHYPCETPPTPHLYTAQHPISYITQFIHISHYPCETPPTPHLYTAQHLIHISHSSSIYHTIHGKHRPPLIPIQHSTSFIYHTVHPYITLSMGNTAHPSSPYNTAPHSYITQFIHISHYQWETPPTPHLYTAQHLIHISHSSSIYHTIHGKHRQPLISIQHSTSFIYHTDHPYITLSMGNTAHPSSLYSTAPHSYITQFIHISHYPWKHRPPLISIQHSTSFIYHTVHPYITLSMGKHRPTPHLYTAQHLIHISHSYSIYHTINGKHRPPLISIQHSTSFIYHTVHPYISIQICHASVGNMTECFPEGGWFFPEGGARGKTILPRGDIPSCYPHWHGILVLLYRTNPVCNCKQSKVTDDW